MKTNKFLIIPLAFLLCASPLFTGCETISKVYQASTTGYNLSASGTTGVVTDDQIVVRTEQALSIALETFDLFLRIEYQNRDALSAVSPQIHVFAENVRRNGKNWIKSTQTAKNAYAQNRNSQNHATLLTAYKTLSEAIAQSRLYMKKAE